MDTPPVFVRQKRTSAPHYRVYVKQFVFGYRAVNQADALDWLEKGGYVDSMVTGDYRMAPCPLGDGWVVELRVWTMSADWKTKKLADPYAWALRHDPRYGPVEVVQRFSKEEKALLAYGKSTKSAVA
jgi:hypothetical protein